MSKHILMIVYHYPPAFGSRGVQRTLKFSRYLPDFGWQPIILTANPRAYPTVRNDQLHEIPVDVDVKRTFCLDTARHLSIRGSYHGWMALPGRWVSWWLGAVPAGLRLLREYRPKVIWSTYPIATAHLIGLTLHCLTSIPWVADFRDLMTGDNYPSDPVAWRVCRWIEGLAVKHCSQAVFTTPGTLRIHAQRYPEMPQSHWVEIPNGYDEENFIAAEQAINGRTSQHERTVLVHSGGLDPIIRDPTIFFGILAELRRSNQISSSNLKIILRACGNEDRYRRQIQEANIQDIVFLEDAICYHKALSEMLKANGLLIFQGSKANHAIPAKVYEHLRARRPIFAMTDPIGDTATLLRKMGINTIVPLDSREEIARCLLNFLDRIRAARAPRASGKEIERYSRKSQTQELAKLLNSLLD